MNRLDLDYQNLLKDILENGIKKETRNGGTISVFGRQIRHNMKDGFPLLTTKKMPFKTIVTELLWFLKGDTNIKYLVDNNCHIWDGDCFSNYLRNQSKNFKNTTPLNFLNNDNAKEEFINKIKTDDEFAKKWGELGPIYGKQWRSWKQHKWDKVNMDTSIKYVDQIQNLISELKTNPDSRRLMVNAWNVGELDQMVLPPCHYGFQVYTRELRYAERFTIHKKYITEDKLDLVFEFATSENLDKLGVPTRAISLMWNQRSVDTFLGLPFNIASYGLLLEIIAKEVNMVPDELIGNLGDVHLYSNHIEQAKEQIGRYFTIEERVAIIPEGVLSPESVEYFNLNKKINSEINVALAKYNISPGLHTRTPYPLPTFDCPAIDEIPHTTFDELIFKLQPADFYMDDYQSYPGIKAPLSN